MEINIKRTARKLASQQHVNSSLLTEIPEDVSTHTEQPSTSNIEQTHCEEEAPESREMNEEEQRLPRNSKEWELKKQYKRNS